MQYSIFVIEFFVVDSHKKLIVSFTSVMEISKIMGTIMQITIKLFAGFRVGRFNETTDDYPKGTRICDILEILQVADKTGVVVLVNGRRASQEHVLHEGDVLALFPLVSGG
jgi:sulfur carrier protein ThiS